MTQLHANILSALLGLLAGWFLGGLIKRRLRAGKDRRKP
jgi:hypothetical protein